MGTIAQKLQAMLNSKAAIKTALQNKGKNPTNVLSTYAGLIGELTNTSGATAGTNDIIEGKTAYVNGSKVTGTYKLPSVSGETLVIGGLVTVASETMEV